MNIEKFHKRMSADDKTPIERAFAGLMRLTPEQMPLYFKKHSQMPERWGSWGGWSL